MELSAFSSIQNCVAYVIKSSQCYQKQITKRYIDAFLIAKEAILSVLKKYIIVKERSLG